MRSLAIFMLVATLLTTISTPGFAQDKDDKKVDKFVSKQYGFSMKVPARKEQTKAASIKIASFYLPAVNGVSANVTVMRQVYEQNLKNYEKLSNIQLTNMGAKIIGKKSSEDTLTYEYTAQLQGQELHFYQRVIKRGDLVFLATGVSAEAQWKANEKAIKESVDSFKFTARKSETKKGAATPKKKF
jgi:hypothetical protein